MILNGKGIRREMYVLPILVEAKLVVKVMFIRRRMLETCRGRLIIWKEACAMNNESELYPTQTSLLEAKKMIAIGAGQELHPVSPSHMIGIIIMSVGIESRLRSVWEITLWVKHSTRFPGRLSRVGSKRGDFLSDFLNPHSPYTMEGRTLWSTLATSIRGWPFPRTSLWYARCSHPIWGLWRWGDLIV